MVSKFRDLGFILKDALASLPCTGTSRVGLNVTQICAWGVAGLTPSVVENGFRKSANVKRFGHNLLVDTGNLTLPFLKVSTQY